MSALAHHALARSRRLVLRVLWLCTGLVLPQELVSGESPARGRLRPVRWKHVAACPVVQHVIACARSDATKCQPRVRFLAIQANMSGFERPCWTLHRVPEECPASIAQLIDACLDHKPANRPSAKELVGILNEQGRMLEQLRSSRVRTVSPVNSRVRCLSAHRT